MLSVLGTCELFPGLATTDRSGASFHLAATGVPVSYTLMMRMTAVLDEAAFTYASAYVAMISVAFRRSVSIAEKHCRDLRSPHSSSLLGSHQLRLLLKHTLTHPEQQLGTIARVV